ncbi:hypothetical protein [Sulfobacillus harzensis]|uniref:Uncharacterized protein n=1 Tax=Sulfobacillus harzensis TaxID=2729629 RepID=A0A7Y0L8G1_9FIRM|nr:hypothetical protein [Sulfobacillus harzensis]NMP25086.1 hypothetical protein [Sulfobacillus harzensis]
MRNQRASVVWIGLIVGIALCALLAAEGLWWAPLLLGFGWAFVATGRGAQFGGSLLIGLLGYGLALAWLDHGAPLAKDAVVTAEIMGFGHAGFLVFLATALLAALLATAGTWLGRAVRLMVRPPKPRYRFRPGDWESR